LAPEQARSAAFPLRMLNSYAAMTRSPGPRWLGQVAPRAWENGVSVTEVATCTSLPLT
jgi:hypothetical protein